MLALHSMMTPSTERNAERWIVLAILSAFSLAGCELETPVFDGDARAGYPEVTTDSGCVCSYPPSDNSFKTVLASLSCVCGAPGRPCATYDVAISRCQSEPFLDLFVERTYAACNLVAVSFHTGFVGGDDVYDAITHELVGTSWGSDVPFRDPCDSTDVHLVKAGTLPLAHCQVTQTRKFCPPSDGGLAGGAPLGL
jgi:hypothetical protein